MKELTTEIVVLGSGPGGYSAAFRAADLGKKVILVEKHERIGGVCLNVGCIPSKALLHAAKVIDDAKEMTHCGVQFAAPTIDIKKIQQWKDSIITKLTTGLSGLAKRRKVEIVRGFAKFISNHSLIVETADGQVQITFDNAIIAAGSSSIKLPFMPTDPRIIDSTGALSLKEAPKRMLIIGGGIIGLEMATVYSAFGSKVCIAEFMPQLIPGADIDLVKPVHKFIGKKCEQIMLSTKVTKVELTDAGLLTHFANSETQIEPQLFDCILESVGRQPNGKKIAADAAGINVDERGFIPVNNRLQTNVAHIFAIGDIIGNPMLAHKAVFEGRLAAEIIAGSNRENTQKPIPSVAYTDPEIAWVGLTETELQKQGVVYGKGVFPWMASGRSLSMNREEGMTKLLFTKDTETLLGAGIVGPNAGELIGELALALEKGCTAHDIAETIHPHPTLSESIMMASEAFMGTITDLYMPKRS
jgi:dihydrolipoamide dehydrogenase